MNFVLFHLLIFYLVVCGYGRRDNPKEKRSADFPSYQEIVTSKPENFKISSSECSFEKKKGDCPVKYKSQGTCNLNSVLSQLFPDVNIEDSTNKFIVPAKFQVARIDIFACGGNPKTGMVRFIAKSVESVELVPQKLTLGVDTRLSLSWNAMQKYQPEKLEVRLKGFTSIGNNRQVELKVEKEIESSDYVLDFKLATLNVNNFLAKFEVDASQMISPDLSFASSRMGLATLIMQEPKVEGLFAPGGGFEIVATGTIAAPELPADANKFYLIVQDFKEGSSESANEGYGKPIAAVFALYKNEKVQDAIASLTGIKIPSIAAVHNVNEAAITVSTKQIFNINSKTLRNLAEKYVPIEGIDLISKGLTVMHFTPNKNADIKNKDQQTAERILFRVEIAKDKLTWTSPQRIETEMAQMSNLVWSREECTPTIAIPMKTKGVFSDISYVVKKNQMQVSLNLTERVPVLMNGLVSLLNTTITLYAKQNANGCNLKLRGTGKETILDELVEITVKQKKHRTTVSAMAEIFDMQTLMNRTQAKPFSEGYEAAFPFVARFPFHDLQYEAVFEKKRVLKFKGFALIDGKPRVEVVYFMLNNQPELKIGFQFENQYLYKVVSMFYGDDKLKSTWMKFKSICVIVKNKELPHPVLFDRGCLRDADSSLSVSGIGFTADQLMVKGCNGNKWKMCKFLKTYIGEVIDMKYVGQMLPKKVRMISRSKQRIELGKGIEFFGEQVVSKIVSTKGGDKLSFEAKVLLTGTSDSFPGRIYDDGTNKIMLRFESGGDSTSGINLLNLNYAKMDPVRSIFAIPIDERVKLIEFQSRLHVGSVQDQQIEFTGHSARQYLSFENDEKLVRFVGEKQKLKISNLYKAFDISEKQKFLKKAMFQGQVIVAYTSQDEVWNATDLDLKVRKGLRFHGKLTLKTEETYETTIKILDTMQLQTFIHLNPLRYGKMANTSQGKPTFQFVNLVLHQGDHRPELGPDLICEGQSQKMKGYAETVGMAGNFTTESLNKNNGNFDYQIKLKGTLYKEVENAEIVLTTKAEDRPRDFKFRYEVDITKQGKENVNKKFRDVLDYIKKQAKKGRDAAKEVVNDVREELDSYKKQRQGHLNEMKSVEEQIHNINSDVDLAMIDISRDCIDQCKTVPMPGIEWKQKCLEGSGGQYNMKCLKWSENKEKVVNVICLLKCEAKKMAAAGEAAASLEEIRILVNRYREQKVLSENIGKLHDLVQQGFDIAKSAKKLVFSKTDIKEEVDGLLAVTGDLVSINVLKVDTDLESISPPCPPFQLDFTLKTTRITTHNGVYPICFNGEFYNNVGLRIMRIKYPAIDEMYKALEEAELRYARVHAIKKSLDRVQEDIRAASKRGKVPSPPADDPVEKMLVKIAKRRIPSFTLKGDKTMLGFHHYSPWAAIRRSNPFEAEPENFHNVKHNSSNLKAKSACHQTKEVISEYKDISDNLEQLSSNYEHGKLLFSKNKASIANDLANSQSDISALFNKTKLSHAEKRDMLYWLQFTKQGMNEYLHTFMEHLTKQNKRSLSFLRSELLSFYGMENFVDHLKEVGSKAIARSNINRTKRDKQIADITEVGKGLHKVLFSALTLDDANAAITKLNGDIESLYKSTDSCY